MLVIVGKQSRGQLAHRGVILIADIARRRRIHRIDSHVRTVRGPKKRLERRQIFLAPLPRRSQEIFGDDEEFGYGSNSGSNGG